MITSPVIAYQPHARRLLAFMASPAYPRLLAQHVEAMKHLPRLTAAIHRQEQLDALLAAQQQTPKAEPA